MAVGGVGGPHGIRFDGAPATESAPAASQAAQQAAVSRTPSTSRPDPTRLATAKSGSHRALSGKAQDFLTNKAERDAFAFIAGIERPIPEILDRLDGLTPGSYNRVLHALGLTRGKAGETMLDVLVARGSSDPGKAKLAQRFFRQLEMKLAGQPGRILEHLAPATKTRLEQQPGWGKIAKLLG